MADRLTFEHRCPMCEVVFYVTVTNEHSGKDFGFCPICYSWHMAEVEKAEDYYHRFIKGGRNKRTWVKGYSRGGDIGKLLNVKYMATGRRYQCEKVMVLFKYFTHNHNPKHGWFKNYQKRVVIIDGPNKGKHVSMQGGNLI